ncbi:transmembrane transcriptional regulator [Corallococcus sp. H22C18031201]|uniref:anti-sigma factor family protein n=1 Tax=Citreicoccus inhibens TaxID=2849499 RepID=UPI000E75DBD8|nr:zf-HC2 domain-containing protein [Citreicoccus inhibens]MBU8899187.1 transmembrane transcriptional regulator [Citreicoccus inhibens]RJS15260.1 transmembrane transcriptional regulator [Corallococcus sp. H22C18031201]
MSGTHEQSTDVEPRLSHREAREAFLSLADEALDAAREKCVRAHLDGCPECREGWERYARTVSRLRGVPREKAPPALATRVMGRVRRQRRFGLRGIHLAHAHQRFPVEILVTLLVAAAVAVFVMTVI